jgi:long-chain fatty acid transport protein
MNRNRQPGADRVELGNELSFGAGFNVQYLDAKLTNAIDFGSLCPGTLGPSPCVPRGLLPQQADGRIRLEGDSIGVGYNLGILYVPDPDTRMGVSYRSRIHHNIAGDADYTVPFAALPLTPGGRLWIPGCMLRSTCRIPFLSGCIIGSIPAGR